MCLCTRYMPGAYKGAQKRASGGFEPPCECWELNMGHLEERSVLLTAETSLQLLFFLVETIGLVFIIQLPHLPVSFRFCCWGTTTKPIFVVC